MSRRSHLPQIRFHKTTGQAYVRLDGKMVYLGKATAGNVPAKVKDRYDEVVRHWLTKKPVDSMGLTVDELAILYLEHACQHYRKNGIQTSEVTSIRSALRMLVTVAGESRVDQFGPLKLQNVRDQMINAGWRRKSINQQVNRIRRAFRWGMSQELIQPNTLAALESVAGLRTGRSSAIESIPVTPVSDDTVEAIRPYVSRQVWSMIQLQRLTGMRPGEVVLMRGMDLNTSGRLWEFRPESHKTEHHGRDRVIVLGPKAQHIVREFLRPDLSEYLFSPVDARKAWNEERRAKRKSPMTPSQAARQPKSRPKWSPRDRYDSRSYGTAIRRACERAFGMPKELRNVSMQLPTARREELKEQAKAWRQANCWSPNQLRHSAATDIRREFGIEAAQNALGHSSPDVTLVYAERSLDQVREVMERLG